MSDSSAADRRQAVAGRDKLVLSRSDALAGAALSLFTTFLFFYFLRTPHLSDALHYMYYAWNIDEVQPVHWDLRVGVIWPTWAIMRLFGYSELSYYTLPFISAILLSLATFLLGRLLFGMWVGLCAGALIVFNPWVLYDITRLGPDYLAAGLFTLCLAMVIALGRHGRLAERPLRGSAVALLFIAGLMLGWSYLAREFIVVLFPIVPLVLLALRSRVVAIVPLALGAFLCWLAELVWGWAVYGNPLIRLFIVWRPGGVERDNSPYETELWGALTHLPNLFVDRPGGWLFAVLAIVALAGTALLALSGERRWQILAAWLVGGWLFFTLIALMPILVLEEGHRILRMDKFRYWALILPPMFVGGFAAIQWALQKAAGLAPQSMRPPAVAGGLAAIGLGAFLVAAQSSQSIADNWRLVRNNTDYLELREFLRQADGQYSTIVFNSEGGHKSSIRTVPLYMQEWNGLRSVWHGDVETYSFDQLPNLVEDERKKLLVVDRTHVDSLDNLYDVPTEFKNPARYAAEVFRSGRGNIVAYDLSRPPQEAEVLFSVSPSDWGLYRSGPEPLSELKHGAAGNEAAIWVEIDEGESVYLHDGRGPRLADPDMADAPAKVTANDAISGQITIDEIDGAENLRVLCLFYGDSGRKRLRALHWVEQSAEEQGAKAVIGFTCTVPGSEGDLYDLRIALMARGPMRLQPRAATVYTRPQEGM